MANKNGLHGAYARDHRMRFDHPCGGEVYAVGAPITVTEAYGSLSPTSCGACVRINDVPGYDVYEATKAPAATFAEVTVERALNGAGISRRSVAC